MPLHPEVAAHLERISGLPPVETLEPAAARAAAEAGAPLLAGPPPELARVEDLDAGGVPIRVYGAGREPRPVVVWYHGGGWVVGSLDTHDVACRRLALSSGCAVVAVDYRLAPEHPYPAAVEDAWRALEWVASNPAAVGGEPGRLAAGGDSAGGNLAAVVAVRARDRGLSLAAQLLVYPVIDCDFETESYRTNAAGYGLTAAAMRWYWGHYAPDEARRLEPEASPLRFPDLAGVAPALVAVCGLDPLLDEGVAYARRLQEAGVPVRLSRYDDMIHGLLRMTAVISTSQALIDDLAAELRKVFGLTTG